MPSSEDEGESGPRSGGAPVEFTSQQITEWKAILKPGKIQKAEQARVSQLSLVTVLSEQLENLPKEHLTVTEDRKFQLIKQEADEVLTKAKHSIQYCVAFTAQHCVSAPKSPQN